jgi:hypothetical protein
MPDPTGGLNALTQMVSAARSSLANPGGATTFTRTMADDIGVTTTPVALNGPQPRSQLLRSWIATPVLWGWARTTSQILAIVTGTKPTDTTHQGVFFPNGLNGLIA